MSSSTRRIKLLFDELADWLGQSQHLSIKTTEMPGRQFGARAACFLLLFAAVANAQISFQPGGLLVSRCGDVSNRASAEITHCGAAV